MKDVEIKGYRFRTTPNITDDGRTLLQLYCPDGMVITNDYQDDHVARCMRLRIFKRILVAKTPEEARAAAETFGRPRGPVPTQRKSYDLRLRIPPGIHDEYLRHAEKTGDPVAAIYRRVIESQVF